PRPGGAGGRPPESTARRAAGGRRGGGRTACSRARARTRAARSRGGIAGWPWAPAGSAARLRRDAVELAAVGEVPLLRRRPAAEILVDGGELELRQPGEIGRRGVLRLRRPVEVPGDRGLRGRRVEEIEIAAGGLAFRLAGEIAIDQRDGRLGEDRERRHDDVESARAELLQGEVRLVLPGDQRVADAAPR